MSKAVQYILDMIQEHKVQMVDCKMVDSNGRLRHVPIPAKNFSQPTVEGGIGFDASNCGYAAILMAGLDGVKNKIDPKANGWGPYDVNLYNLSDEEKAKLQCLPTSLEAAHDYLTAGGVFSQKLISNFIKRGVPNAAAWLPFPVPPSLGAASTCRRGRL